MGIVSSCTGLDCRICDHAGCNLLNLMAGEEVAWSFRLLTGVIALSWSICLSSSLISEQPECNLRWGRMDNGVDMVMA